MEHNDLYDLRETYNKQQISLCFNGPFSQGLIEEIGNALRKYMQSEAASSSTSMDIFSVYIELAQNIQHYSAQQNYSESDSSATVVIGRDEEGRYVISAGNIVEPEDGATVEKRVQTLAAMDKAELKATYKTQLRQPSSENGAGLGLIDIARKSSLPISCALRPTDEGGRSFFSLRVVI